MPTAKRTPKRRLLSGSRSAAGRKVDEALIALRSVGIPVDSLTAIERDRIALALLSISNIRPSDTWSNAGLAKDGSQWRLATREIIAFQNTNWFQKISPGSYDDIRRKDLKLLVLAGIAVASAENPNANQNNPTRRYALTKDAGDLIRSIGADEFVTRANEFLSRVGSLEERLERYRPKRIGIQLPDGRLLQLADGEHNQLQKAILEEFIPRFVADAKVLYLGDASNKRLHVDEKGLAEIGLREMAHEMLPDVVVIDTKNRWLVLIEAVHSSNPISKTRHIELENFTINCLLPRVYVSVFASRADFRAWVCDISWETEVWLVESPGHMIHFNGDKYLGPHTVS
jgi:hypothetical protein